MDVLHIAPALIRAPNRTWTQRVQRFRLTLPVPREDGSNANRSLRLRLLGYGGFRLPGGFWLTRLLLPRRQLAHGGNVARQGSVSREEPRRHDSPQRAFRAALVFDGY